MQKPKKPTAKELAAKHGVSTKTVSRWKADGAPINDPKRLALWLAGRKNIPSSAIASPVHRDGATVSADPGTEGASHTLKRLEHEELAAYNRLQTAISGGDPLQIREARKGWLEVSELLRKVDLAIEDSRRQLGELIPRSEVERAIEFFLVGSWIEFAMIANSFPSTVAGAGETEVGKRFEEVKNLAWLNGVFMASAGCPQFLRPIMKKAVAEHFIKAAANYDGIVEKLEKALAK